MGRFVTLTSSAEDAVIHIGSQFCVCANGTIREASTAHNPATAGTPYPADIHPLNFRMARYGQSLKAVRYASTGCPQATKRHAIQNTIHAIRGSTKTLKRAASSAAAYRRALTLPLKGRGGAVAVTYSAASITPYADNLLAGEASAYTPDQSHRHFDAGCWQPHSPLAVLRWQPSAKQFISSGAGPHRTFKRYGVRHLICGDQRRSNNFTSCGRCIWPPRQCGDRR